ncbi:TorF family putative porin [uncultured Pseudomonas sp.]|uniref:TorF family putative porin n=1 Tax=uncultured Pseudomonas sp. TaxID=114707 RepID=UPI002629B69C|nr:TorF family putative porin [uncultured Pseudomonas sp.]
MRQFALISLLLSPLSPAVAVELNDQLDLSLNVTALSDYRSRGQSQTLGDPALQASATLAHSNGLYLGAWTSNVDFGFDYKARQEVDYYAGYYWQMSADVSLDMGYVHYSYPRQSNFNFAETYGILSAYGVSLGLQYADDFTDNQSYLWSYLGYATTLPADVGLNLRYGKVDYKDPVLVSNSGSSRSNYNEWEVKLDRDLMGLNWSLSYVDSDMSKAECLNYLGFDDICGAAVVAGISKDF